MRSASQLRAAEAETVRKLGGDEQPTAIYDSVSAAGGGSLVEMALVMAELDGPPMQLQVERPGGQVVNVDVTVFDNITSWAENHAPELIGRLAPIAQATVKNETTGKIEKRWFCLWPFEYWCEG